MGKNNRHYFDAIDPLKEEMLRSENPDLRFSEPKFVGQGCSHRAGSDTYGFYIANIVNDKLIAIVAANAKFDKSWSDGLMNCCRPENWQDKNTWQYLAKYGKKWYRVDPSTMKRIKGAYFKISFVGAYAYRDPSF